MQEVPFLLKLSSRGFGLYFQSSPYIMEKLDSTSKQRVGNDRYEGFIIDLASQISSIVGFNYTIKVTTGYGSVNAEGEWNGMIKELLDEVIGCPLIC